MWDKEPNKTNFKPYLASVPAIFKMADPEYSFVNISAYISLRILNLVSKHT